KLSVGFRQREDVDHVASGDRIPVAWRGDEVGNPSTATGGDGNVLAAVDRIGDRMTLSLRAQPRLPEHLTRVAIEGAEVAIEPTGEEESPRGDHRRRVQGRLGLPGPDRLTGFEVDGVD